MADQDTFGALLGGLRKAPGLVPKLRLLSGAARGLRSLSPRERGVLVKMAGLGGAEALIERLAGGDRDTERAFRRIVGAIEKRPEQFEETLQGLLDPARRTEAATSLIHSLDEALQDPDEGSEESEPEVDAGPEPEAETGEPPRDGEVPRTEERPERAGAAPPVPRPPPEQRSAKPPEPPEPEPVRAQKTDLGPEPEAPEVREVRKIPEPDALASAEIPSEPREAPPPLVPIPGTPAPSPWATFGAEPTPKPVPEEPPTGPLAELARRLDAEDPGWARRRALQTWIEEADADELAAGLERLLELISGLERPSARLWCLTSLAGSRPWDDERWARILEAAGSATLQRRLEHRRVG